MLIVFHLGTCVLAEADEVGDEAERRLGREDVGPAGDVFLEDVVLDRPGQRLPAHAPLLGQGEVHRQEDGGRGVDRHRDADLVERDAVEQDGHVLERVDGHADLADLARGQGVVGIEAELGRQVEGDAQAGLALVEEIAIAGVGFPGGAEAGVLAHGPEPAAVHRRVDAAGEGETRPAGPRSAAGSKSAEVLGGVEILVVRDRPRLLGFHVDFSSSFKKMTSRLRRVLARTRWDDGGLSDVLRERLRAGVDGLRARARPRSRAAGCIWPPLAAAHGAGLDLARAEGDAQVGDERVLGLARSGGR